MQIGLYTFGDVVPEPGDQRAAVRRRYRELMEEIELADRVGLDVFGVGEHHRPDFPVSAPAMVLAAAAGRTERIRLTSAVTVLSSDDPVRVFQQYATLDNLSDGRAEIIVGRGSFIESYPLFGFDLDHYDELFAEKLDLLLRIADDERVTWRGRHRPPIEDRGVYPRPVQDRIPVWVAVGGTPPSVVRAGRLGLPLGIAIIGGMPERFAPLVGLYRESAAGAGHDAGALPVSINSLGLVADTTEAAADVFYGPYKTVMDQLGRERGWGVLTRTQYDMLRGPRGALVVGDPAEVVRKILFEHEHFGHDRFLLQTSIRGVPHEATMRSIELLGTEVAPAVRAALA